MADVDSGATWPEFRPWLCHLLATGHYEHTHFTGEIGTIIAPTSWTAMRTGIVNLYVNLLEQGPVPGRCYMPAARIIITTFRIPCG